jgi:hypothetical protein
MHIIRLRGPWQLEPVERWVRRADGGYDQVCDDLPAATKATMPADWSESFGPEFFGRVRYSRHFNLPTGLEPNDKVFLVVEPPRSRAQVRLNGQALGELRFGGPAARFDVARLLAVKNSLEIEVEHPEPDDGSRGATGGLVGEVRLEIEGA